jgi:hypothetical protein
MSKVHHVGFQNPAAHSPQQQTAATEDDDDNLEKAKMHQMAPRHMSLETIYYEWYGLESFKDKPIAGGFERCEQRLSSTEGGDIPAAVATLAPIYQGDCKKSISKMEDWMTERGFIQKGKSRKNSPQFDVCGANANDIPSSGKGNAGAQSGRMRVSLSPKQLSSRDDGSAPFPKANTIKSCKSCKSLYFAASSLLERGSTQAAG